jgi:hypothetical protein
MSNSFCVRPIFNAPRESCKRHRDLDAQGQLGRASALFFETPLLLGQP